MTIIGAKVTGLLNMSVIIAVIFGILGFVWLSVKSSAGAFVFVSTLFPSTTCD
jgi:hypothetical protein